MYKVISIRSNPLSGAISSSRVLEFTLNGQPVTELQFLNVVNSHYQKWGPVRMKGVIDKPFYDQASKMYGEDAIQEIMPYPYFNPNRRNINQTEIYDNEHSRLIESPKKGGPDSLKPFMGDVPTNWITTLKYGLSSQLPQDSLARKKIHLLDAHSSSEDLAECYQLYIQTCIENNIHPKFDIQLFNKKGFGLVCHQEMIPAGTFLGVYAGEVVDTKMERPKTNATLKKRSYLMINKGKHINSRSSGFGRNSIDYLKINQGKMANVRGFRKWFVLYDGHQRSQLGRLFFNQDILDKSYTFEMGQNIDINAVEYGSYTRFLNVTEEGSKAHNVIHDFIPINGRNMIVFVANKPIVKGTELLTYFGHKNYAHSTQVGLDEFVSQVCPQISDGLPSPDVDYLLDQY